MIDRKSLLKQLKEEVNDIEKLINNPKKYYINNKKIMNLLKVGVAVDRLLPFIITSVICFNWEMMRGNTPFITNDVVQEASVSKYMSSNGEEKINYSFDYEYDEEFIEYRTSWEEKENDFYEQTVTSYRVDNYLNLSNVEEILSMSKEELDEKLVVENVTTNLKNDINKEEVKAENIVAINIVYNDKNNTIIRDETIGEDMASSICYLLEAIVWGNFFRILKKKIGKEKVKKYLDEKYEKYEAKTEDYDKRTLEDWKKILKLKKENLSLLDDSYLNTENKKLVK